MKKLLVLLLTMIMLVMGAVFISCDEVVNFKVSFVVDDAVYSTIDTSGNEVIKMPENPTKEGYTFEGWYWDKDVWTKPFTANSLLDTPLSSDMNVYAKWEHIHTPSDWIEDTPADYGVAGSKHKECTVCKVVLETEVIPALLQGTDIMSEALAVNGETAYVSLSNATGTFSFLNDITVADGASYVVARDIGCEQTIASKTVSLNIGDNVYYILVTNGNAQKLYTVTVRRRPMYTVTFNTVGGSSVPSQTIEEGYYLTAPKETTRAGYTFNGWNADLTAPITANKTITAQWTANTDTPYKVEYYKENVDKNGYDLVDTQNLTGTTDTRANAEQKTFEHFTLNTSKSTLNGNINGNGTLVLRVYYTRNTYNVTLNKTSGGTVTGGGTYGYDKQITITATPHLGYNFIGWFENNTLITDNISFTVAIADTHLFYTAKFELDPAMSNFIFTSTTTTCTITGVIDKTIISVVLPDYITDIEPSAPLSCNKLVEVINKSTLDIINDYSDWGNVGYYVLEVHTGESKIVNKDGYLFYTYNGVNYLVNYVGTDTALTLPSDYNGQSYEIYKYAFDDNYKIKSVVIPDGVTSIGDDAFWGCSSLTSVNIGNGVKSIGSCAFEYCSSLTSVNIGNGVKSIGNYAFYFCTGLTSVTIPDSVTSIGSYAFYKTGLTSIDIPDSVTSIGAEAFGYCSKLLNITIGNGVTSLPCLLSGCSSLESITIPFVGGSLNASTASSLTLFGYIFGTPWYSGGREIDQYFSSSFDYATYCIPSSLKSVTITGGKIHYGAFYGYSWLKNITIGNGVTSIGYKAFNMCSGLENVYITNIASWCKIRFYDEVSNPLYYAKNLYINGNLVTELIIPTNITSIASYAFYNFDGLTKITISNNITSIGERAFDSCGGITNINYTGTQTQWLAISKGSYWYPYSNYKITYNYTGE